MPTHLYCLVGPANEPPTGLAGVAGSPVRGLAAGPLLAWVSTLEAPARPTMQALQQHDAVTRAALETGDTPVPVQFGQRFAEDAACAAALRARVPALLRARERVAGCVEMTVQVRLPSPDGQPDRPGQSADAGVAAHGERGAGTAYLETLRGRTEMERFVRENASHLRRRLSGAVAPFVRSEAAQLSVSPPLLTLSHLVPREAVASYRTALSSLGAVATPSAVVRGPDAPYSFVTVDER